jgi:terminase small subunit / prophage DNA-packing protein
MAKRVKYPTVTLSQFAKLVGTSAQTVTNWRREGMPCAGGGRHGAAARVDLEQALPWVIARRDTRPDSQRERLAREQADRVAIDNAERRGELVDAQMVDVTLSRFAAEIKAQHQTIVNRCAHEFAAVTDPQRVRERLLEEFTAMGERLSAVAGDLADKCERAALAAESSESMGRNFERPDALAILTGTDRTPSNSRRR